VSKQLSQCNIVQRHLVAVMTVGMSVTCLTFLEKAAADERADSQR